MRLVLALAMIVALGAGFGLSAKADCAGHSAPTTATTPMPETVATTTDSKTTTTKPVTGTGG